MQVEQSVTPPDGDVRPDIRPAHRRYVAARSAYEERILDCHRTMLAKSTGPKLASVSMGPTLWGWTVSISGSTLDVAGASARVQRVNGDKPVVLTVCDARGIEYHQAFKIGKASQVEAFARSVTQQGIHASVNSATRHREVAVAHDDLRAAVNDCSELNIAEREYGELRGLSVTLPPPWVTCEADLLAMKPHQVVAAVTANRTGGSPTARRRLAKFAAVAVLGIAGVAGIFVWGAAENRAEERDKATDERNRATEEPVRRTTPAKPVPIEPELRFCPDALEELGPFIAGIDPLYDPTMDWDGDGVSCE